MAKKAQMKKKAAIKKPPVKAAKKAPPAKTKPAAPAKKAAPAAKPAARPAAAAAPSPAGRHSITPHLVVRGASHAIEFYRRAFGAKEVYRMPSPDGFGIMHADLIIGNGHIYLCDEMPQMQTNRSPQALGGSPVTIMLYVDNVDQVYKQAVEAGGTATMPPADMFWGDRYGKLLDPFGHDWALATHKEDVSPAEMEKRFKVMAAKMGQGAPPQ